MNNNLQLESNFSSVLYSILIVFSSDMTAKAKFDAEIGKYGKEITSIINNYYMYSLNFVKMPYQFGNHMIRDKEDGSIYIQSSSFESEVDVTYLNSTLMDIRNGKIKSQSNTAYLNYILFIPCMVFTNPQNKIVLQSRHPVVSTNICVACDMTPINPNQCATLEFDDLHSMMHNILLQVNGDTSIISALNDDLLQETMPSIKEKMRAYLSISGSNEMYEFITYFKHLISQMNIYKHYNVEETMKIVRPLFVKTMYADVLAHQLALELSKKTPMKSYDVNQRSPTDIANEIFNKISMMSLILHVKIPPNNKKITTNIIGEI